ncbi:MAG TPA: tyrosine-type recombinase/integrase [Acidimicrobiales bacterium]|nr:tyrosine-type recombinase/integrase [Acidimicrobiales bacterium]
MAFETFARNWLESDPSKRPSTRARDRTIVERHLIPALGSTPLRRIKFGDVQALVNSWTATLQPSTVGRQFTCLQAIMSSAVRNEKLGKSPCVGIKLPETTRRRKLILDPAMLAQLAEKLAPDGAMAYVGAALGLRWGEVAGLRVDDVDLDNAVVSVGHQRTRGEHGRMVEGAPKSAAGVRTLAMPAGLVAILRDHLEARGISELDHGAYLFAGSKGGPLHYSNWRRRVWVPACRALGLPDGFRFHDLRGMNATLLIKTGADVKTTQTRLGHSSPQVTLGLYAEATSEGDRRAAAAIDAELFGGPDQKLAKNPTRRTLSRG